MNDEQKESLYGKPGRGEYPTGATIRFRDHRTGQVLTGKVLYVRAPGPAIVGGRQHPTTYMVEVGDDFPHAVYSRDILEEL